MRPVAIDGDVWLVNRVPPGSPLLIDRTGRLRLATTDPASKTISLSDQLRPPMLDRVLLHEMAHAVSISHGLLPIIGLTVPEEHRVFVEEWSAELLEKHGMEAIMLASESLGRPLCIMGHCMMVY